MHSPVPSHTRTLHADRRRLLNRNKSPHSGSLPRPVFTNPYNPLYPFRRSTASGYANTRTDRLEPRIIRVPAVASPPQPALHLQHGNRLATRPPGAATPRVAAPLSPATMTAPTWPPSYSRTSAALYRGPRRAPERSEPSFCPPAVDLEPIAALFAEFLR